MYDRECKKTPNVLIVGKCRIPQLLLSFPSFSALPGMEELGLECVESVVVSFPLSLSLSDNETVEAMKDVWKVSQLPNVLSPLCKSAHGEY